MSKPIAELMVETMATLRAVTVHSPAQFGTFSEFAWSLDTAEEEAAKIVSRVYGEPCEASVFYVAPRSAASIIGHVMNGPEYAPMTDAWRPSAECDRCKWPRSFHP